ncbi:hypothetical protein Pcinc_017050 [Petrolisthes cinctipes]|uniref:Uncharacterized protein n=1 Tax=Petrolisthes cinctipes TaxID=88211 RepID=A0AAE1FPW4_PETCI|nr:hypothetical protein Pcinc_017050 [Petrolisthes cinctipes]
MSAHMCSTISCHTFPHVKYLSWSSRRHHNSLHMVESGEATHSSPIRRSPCTGVTGLGGVGQSVTRSRWTLVLSVLSSAKVVYYAVSPPVTGLLP